MMGQVHSNSEFLDQKQSLQLIQEMIQVSKKKLRSDGILLIIWGYAASLTNLINYFKEVLFLPNRIMYVLKFIGPVLWLLAFGFYIYYIYNERKRVTTYIGDSLRYIWISLLGCMVFTNLIIYNVTNEVNFSLQHPLFMILTAFAVIVTGVILRYKPIIFGGVIFGILAYCCSFFDLHTQLLFDGIAWLLAIVIPGHILYYNRDK